MMSYAERRSAQPFFVSKVLETLRLGLQSWHSMALADLPASRLREADFANETGAYPHAGPTHVA